MCKGMCVRACVCVYVFVCERVCVCVCVGICLRVCGVYSVCVCNLMLVFSGLTRIAPAVR